MGVCLSCCPTMPRAKSYDEDAVLTAAMQAFRVHGYGALSIKQLEDCTGLKAGSIYNSFTDKAGLFEAALAHYTRKVVQGRIDTYLVPAQGLKGLRAMFMSLLREPDGGRHGCLLTNTAIEFGGDSRGREHAPGRRLLQSGLDLLRHAFEGVLRQAQATGELALDTDPATLALKLLALYQGILVLVRSGVAEDRGIKRLIDAEFHPLGPGAAIREPSAS